MLYIDWYLWPIVAILGITLIGLGTQDLLQRNPKANYLLELECNPQKFDLIKLLGNLEITAGAILLVPAIINRQEIAFIAFIGSFIALCTPVIRILFMWKYKSKTDILVASATVSLSSILIVLLVY